MGALMPIFTYTFAPDATPETKKAWIRRVERFAKEQGFTCNIKNEPVNGKDSLICDVPRQLNVFELRLFLGGDKLSEKDDAYIPTAKQLADNAWKLAAEAFMKRMREDCCIEQNPLRVRFNFLSDLVAFAKAADANFSPVTQTIDRPLTRPLDLSGLSEYNKEATIKPTFIVQGSTLKN